MIHWAFQSLDWGSDWAFEAETHKSANTEKNRGSFFMGERHLGVSIVLESKGVQSGEGTEQRKLA